MAMNPVTLRRFAEGAREDAKDYREQADNALLRSTRESLLKSAEIREEDADFYISRAAIIERTVQ